MGEGDGHAEWSVGRLALADVVVEELLAPVGVSNYHTLSNARPYLYMTSSS